MIVKVPSVEIDHKTPSLLPLVIASPSLPASWDDWLCDEVSALSQEGIDCPRVHANELGLDHKPAECNAAGINL